MPYIEAKFTMNLDETKRNLICEKIESIVSGNFRKPKSFLMTELKDNVQLRMGGNVLKKGAYISIKLFGEITKGVCSVCTGEISNMLKKELDIDEKNIYITYHPVEFWGWDRRLF